MPCSTWPLKATTTQARSHRSRFTSFARIQYSFDLILRSPSCPTGLSSGKYTLRLYFGHFGFGSQHELKEYLFGVSIHSFRWQQSFHSDGNNGLWSRGWCCALHYAWRAFHPKGGSTKNISKYYKQTLSKNSNCQRKAIQNLSKKLPTKFSLMNCPQLRAFGSCTAQVTLSLCWTQPFKTKKLKDAIPPGGQERHSFWTSQIDSNHGENWTWYVWHTVQTFKLMVVDLCDAFSSKCSENYFPHRCPS